MKLALISIALMSLLFLGCIEKLDSLEKSLEGKMIEKPECGAWITEDCNPTPLPLPHGAINGTEFRKMMVDIPGKYKQAMDFEKKMGSPFVYTNKTMDLDECEKDLQTQFEDARKDGYTVTTDDENREFNMFCSMVTSKGILPAKPEADEITVTNFKPNENITKDDCINKYKGKEVRKDRLYAACTVLKTTCLKEAAKANVDELMQKYPNEKNLADINALANQSAGIYCGLNQAFDNALDSALGIKDGQIQQEYNK